MNRWRNLFIVIALLFGLEARPAQASRAGVYLFPHWVDTTHFPEVTVYLSAWNASGVPLDGLQPEAFILSEDGGAPLHPAQAQIDRDAAVQVALVIDVSASMSGRPLQDAQQAAARFLDKLGPQDQAALVAFSSGVKLDANALDTSREIAFTAGKAQVYDVVEQLAAGGSTELYNAAAKAALMFSAEPDGHRAVLLLSDGRNEPADVGDPGRAIELAQAAGVPYYVIGLGSQIDQPYLQRLASETGGMFMAAPSSAELARLFADMATLLKTQYRLTYTSALPQDGQAHDLSITLRSQAGEALAQARLGPLPLQVVPTAAPTTAVPPTLQPTAAPTAVRTGAPATAAPQMVSDAAPPKPPATQSSSLLLIGAVAFVAVLLAAAWLILRRLSAPHLEHCLKCGYNLTGRPGACPQCGETRRAPIQKGLK